MRYFMGLDLSLRGAGAVVVDEDGVVQDFGLWGEDLDRSATVKQKVERLVYIADKIIRMANRARSEGTLFIGIEDYAYSRRGAQNDLGEIGGTVKTQIWLALKSVPNVIAASSARKEALGKGRFSKGKKGKKEIINAVCKRGFEVSDDNIADAYVIAECLRMRIKGGKISYK